MRRVILRGRLSPAGTAPGRRLSSWSLHGCSRHPQLGCAQTTGPSWNLQSQTHNLNSRGSNRFTGTVRTSVCPDHSTGTAHPSFQLPTPPPHLGLLLLLLHGHASVTLSHILSHSFTQSVPIEGYTITITLPIH